MNTQAVVEETQTEGEGEEPSMEEILASIRKIITDENGVEHEVTDEEDVLELTDVVEEDGSVVNVAEQEPEEAAQTEENVPPPLTSVQEVVEEEVEKLVSDTTEQAVSNSFADLASELHQDHQPIAPISLGNANKTIEDLTREMLRPMLKDWLDANLPPLVDRLVREEIHRLSVNERR